MANAFAHFSEARVELEKPSTGKVGLEVWVKVKSGWAGRRAALKSLATSDPGPGHGGSSKQRIEQQPAWVLYTYPVARNQPDRRDLRATMAASPWSLCGALPVLQLRGVLMAFQPLLMDWSGGWRGQDPGACRMAGRAAAADRAR